MKRRIAVIERRSAAVHEAGHLVVGRFVGLRDVDAWIFPRPEAGVDQKTWGGKAEFSSTQVQRLPALERRMFAVAGSVAERCWRREFVDPWLWQEPAMMSSTDWQTSRCAPGDVDELLERAIQRTGGLLEAERGELWHELCRVAHALIQDARPV